MPSFLRNHAWRLGISLLLVGGVTAGIAMLRNAPSEAYPSMPADQQAYWRWVGSINREPASAVASGLLLLRDQAHLPALYLRLAQVCAGTDEAAACRAALTAARPPDTRTALYRDAALLQLLPPEQSDSAVAGWKRLAGAPALDPTLARLVVDRARASAEAGWLPEIEAVWDDVLARDSSQAGVAFGLGYAAVLRNEWDRSEALLRHATRLVPGDPQPYRELGRIYYFTGQPDAFEATLEAGIAAARSQFNVEQELVMRGNLGLAMMQWKGDYERAGKLFEEALEQSLLLSNQREEAFNRYRLGTVRLNQHRYTDALALLDSAGVLFATHVPALVPEVVAQRGLTLGKMYRFTEAEAALEEAVREAEARENNFARVQALAYLVDLQYDMGRYTSARTTGLQALELAARYRFPELEILARTTLGDIERAGGNYGGAETHYQEGRLRAEQTANQLHMRTLDERLGLLALRRQDANAAQAYFQRILDNLADNTSGRELAVTYLGLGYVYDQFSNFDEAIRLYDLALAQLPAEGENKLRVDILRSKAISLINLDAFDKATALLEEAKRRAAESENPENEYDVEVALGYAYLQQQQYEKALRHYLLAEHIEDELQWSSVHWFVLHGKAVAYWRLGRRDEAEQAFRDAIGIAEELREYVNSAEGRALFVQDKVQVYEDFSAFLEEQGRTTEALGVNERARSRSLVDLLYTTQQGRKLDLNDPADRAIELNRRVRAIEHGMDEGAVAQAREEAAAYRTNRAAYLRRERLSADSLYRRVEIDLYGENEIYTFNPLQADSIRATLEAGEALVAFNLRTLSSGAAGRSASVAYVVLPDTVYVRHLAVDPAELTERIRFFREQISSSNTGPGTGWEPTARRLYADLMAPVRTVLPASVRHLHLVPEGMLHYLPFAALQDERGRFLVEQYALSVVPSATTLKLCRERNPKRWSYMLLLADPDGRLPGTRKEVTAIAADAPNRRHVLVGKDATQEMFTEIANNYDVLHFATHGNFISRVPWRSHLELYGGELSVEEIGHLRLNAYLVTLSACETALSSGLTADVPNGDEWVGLNQAFLAAGTPTVLASLWAIDDRLSSTFMIGFYDRLGPEGKAAALAAMQRHFIHNPETRHPFYWAAFTLIGDPL